MVDDEYQWEKFSMVYCLFFFFLGDSSFRFSKETWRKLFQFTTIYSPDDRTLRVMGDFTQAGTEQLSKEAHTLEVYCQIPPQYGNFTNAHISSDGISLIHSIRSGYQLFG